MLPRRVEDVIPGQRKPRLFLGPQRRGSKLVPKSRGCYPFVARLHMLPESLAAEVAGALAFANGVATEQALRNLLAKDFNGEELLGLTFTTFEAYTRKHQTVQVWKWSAQRWRWNRPAPRSKPQRRSAPAGRRLTVGDRKLDRLSVARDLHCSQRPSAMHLGSGTRTPHIANSKSCRQAIRRWNLMCHLCRGGISGCRCSVISHPPRRNPSQRAPQERSAPAH